MEENWKLNEKESKRSSLELFKMKKLLEELASKKGRHTELITLYIPPGRQLSEVLNTLRQEYGTASNIKSRTTRHNVQDAIEKVIQKLKLFRETPPTGLAVFCGAIPYGPPGSEKMEIYVVIPPRPLDIYLYRCNSRFHVEPLLDMFKEKETYGILVMDNSGATFATLKGRHLEIVKSITSGISSKHRAGGQSARRFERLREAEINEYYKRVANYANQIFLGIPDLKGLIIGGPGPSKQYFVDGDYLHYTLKNKILAVVDTSYVDEQGVKEIVRRSSEILKDVRYVEEKNIIQQFLAEVGKDGLAVYGFDEVKKSLEAGNVKTLLLSEDLDLMLISVKCSNCGYSENLTMKPADLVKFEFDLSKRQCPKCGNQGLNIVDRKPLIDFFTELAEKLNVNVEMISSSHEEGEMLLNSFGGVAAILKYKG